MGLLNLFRKLLRIFNYMRKQWRNHFNSLILIVIKSFIAYLLVFILTLSIFTALTPEYPQHKLHLIFRVYDHNLVGVTLRQELITACCTPTDQEFIFQSKFPKAQICYLKHQPFPQLVNEHFNVVVRGIDARSRTAMVCWLRKGSKEEVCQELVVHNGQVIARSVNILSVDLVQVLLRGDPKVGFAEPEVWLELDENGLMRWIRKSYAVVSFGASHFFGLTVTLIILIVEILNFWNKAKETTKNTGE